MAPGPPPRRTVRTRSQTALAYGEANGGLPPQCPLRLRYPARSHTGGAAVLPRVPPGVVRRWGLGGQRHRPGSAKAPRDLRRCAGTGLGGPRGHAGPLQPGAAAAVAVRCLFSAASPFPEAVVARPPTFAVSANLDEGLPARTSGRLPTPELTTGMWVAVGWSRVRRGSLRIAPHQVRGHQQDGGDSNGEPGRETDGYAHG